MPTRYSNSVVVKETATTHDGETKTVLYGPFLPHAGSATKWFVATRENELNESGRYQSWELEVEEVFIAEDESDCTVQATR